MKEKSPFTNKRRLDVCPGCGKKVMVMTFTESKKEYTYEQKPLTKIEEKVQERLGLPFQGWQFHKCKTD